MQHHAQVEEPCFLCGIYTVLADAVQEVFGHGAPAQRPVEEKAFLVEIVALRGKRICDNDGAARKQQKRPVELFFEVAPVRLRLVVIRVHCQDGARELVHDVDARRSEDHVFRKTIRQVAVLFHYHPELVKLLFFREVPEYEQICRFFKPRPVFAQKPVYDINDVYASVIQLALHRGPLAVAHVVTLGAAYPCDPRHNARAVLVSEAAFDGVCLEVLFLKRNVADQLRCMLADELITGFNIH
jgi:hypothetical protein